MDKILCVSEIIFSFSDPRQYIGDELRYMKTLCLSEVKMAATAINVVNCFGIIFPSYFLFFKKSVSKIRLYVHRP